MVGEMAYVEVEEVLTGKDESASPSVGTVVGVLFAGGVTIIDETTFCRERMSGFFRASIGDEVLVGGAMSRNDPNYFHVNFVFPIVDREVLAQPYSELTEDAVSISVKNLRNEIRLEVRQ